MDYLGALTELKSGRLRPVYLLWGEERSLREELLSLIKQQVLKAGATDFGVTVLGGKDLSADRIIETADTTPFFSENQLIIIDNWERLRSGKQTESGSEKNKSEEQRLIQYLTNVPAFSCLVFTCDEKVDRRKKLYLALEQQGLAVELAPLKGAALERWVAQQAGELGKRFESGVMAFIVNEVGTSEHVDLTMLKQELTKIALYVGNRKEITKQDAQKVLTRTPESSVFALVDAVGHRNAGKAMQLWDDLRIAGQEPLKMLNMIARQIRMIWQARQLLDAGYAIDQVAGKIGCHPYVAQRVAGQGKNFTSRQLRTALENLQEADWSVKSGTSDAETMMQLLIVKLCLEETG